MRHQLLNLLTIRHFKSGPAGSESLKRRAISLSGLCLLGFVAFSVVFSHKWDFGQKSEHGETSFSKNSHEPVSNSIGQSQVNFPEEPDKSQGVSSGKTSPAGFQLRLQKAIESADGPSLFKIVETLDPVTEIPKRFEIYAYMLSEPFSDSDRQRALDAMVSELRGLNLPHQRAVAIQSPFVLGQIESNERIKLALLQEICPAMHLSAKDENLPQVWNQLKLAARSFAPALNCEELQLDSRG